jgi:hypothetical protein
MAALAEPVSTAMGLPVPRLGVSVHAISKPRAFHCPVIC